MSETGIYVILDGSGSMSGVKHDVVTGINEFIKEQQEESKKSGTTAHFTLTSFDGKVNLVYMEEDLDLVKPVTVKDTYLGGSTALLDTIGTTLTNAKRKSARNLLVIYTDGGENASTKYTKEQIEKKIKALDKTGKWQVIYLGAEFADFAKDTGYSAVAVSGKVGSINTSKTNVGQVWNTVAQTTSYMRGMSNTAYASMAGSNTTVMDSAATEGNIDWKSLDENKDEKCQKKVTK